MPRIQGAPDSCIVVRPRSVLFTLVTGWACCPFVTCTAADQAPTLPPESDASPLRDVRVLVWPDAERVRIRSQARLSILTEDGEAVGVQAARRRLTLEPGADRAIMLDTGSRVSTSVTIMPLGSATESVSVFRNGKWSAALEYAGPVQLRATDEDRLEVINLVDVEQYVAGVVAKEVWPTFVAEACRAQAVVARTFVLYQMSRRKDAAWDVTATQASQVYGGVRTDAIGRRASRATQDTRGVVCTWNDNGKDRLFSTYYSSVCGGMSQSAAIFGKGDDIPPLAGGVSCDYCRIAPKGTHRWGPVHLKTDRVLDKLLKRYPDLKSLGKIVEISVAERSDAGPSSGRKRSPGRPVRLRITGSTGQTHEMLAERFRLAVGADVMLSTDCRIRVAGDQMVLDHGRGFGHGLGLCQWGMQGQAVAGKRAGEIIRYYYPGCRLMRAY